METSPSPLTNVDAAAGATPFLFLVGAPRSGTTLLKRMLNAHTDVAMTPESWWIPRFYKRRTGLTEEGLVTPAIIPALFADKRFPRLQLTPEAVEEVLAACPGGRYADFVSGLLTLFGKASGKPLVGDKTPGYVRNIRVLHRLWPQAKFVHIIRDGRDVALSVRNWAKRERTVGDYQSWTDEPVATIGLWWKWHVGLGREAGEALPADRYHELRYETLVAEPEATLGRLCDFLGLAYQPAMLRYYEGRQDETKAHPWTPVTPGLRNWRNQMAADDLLRFEAVAGDLLQTLGYPLGAPPPDEHWTAYGNRLRAAFEGRPLPRVW